MRQKKTSVLERLSFFIVLLVILAIVAYTVFGMVKYGNAYMRFGIDIKGGVSATYESAEASTVPTDEQLESAKAIIETRLDGNNVLDRTVTIDRENHAILVEFPWQATETDFDPVAAISELGETAKLTFAIATATEDTTGEGVVPYYDENNNPIGYYKMAEPFMDGSVVKSASSGYLSDKGYVVNLEFKDEGTSIFSTTTSANVGNRIGIMMDDRLISVATVDEAITTSTCYISGSFTAAEAKSLATKINSGALPFSMQTSNYSSVSATMGTHALNVMILAGLIALCIIALFLIIYYKVPGVVASITLLLQTAGQLLIFHLLGLTLTLPGIAGIILSIGMGVDSNIIIAERIKEELRAGKTLRGAISLGYSRAFSAVLDCNVTTAAVAILLMIFGTGAMLSFSYTLLIGIVMNFGLSIISSKLMLQSLACYKALGNPKFYGYKAAKEVQ